MWEDMAGGFVMKSIAISFALVLGILGPAEINPCASGAAFAQTSACCKMCSKGKACGDSCIARDKVCHKGKGCA